MNRLDPDRLQKASPNELTEIMVDLRASGETFARIAGRTGYSAEECAQRVHNYLVSAYSSTSVNEMRMLQVIRLEKIMNALWSQVMGGDLALEGKGATNLIAAIDKVTELLDLKKDRLRDEQVILTRAQSGLLMAALDQVRLDMLDRVLELFGSEHLQLRQEVTTVWDGIFAEITEKAIGDNESTTVQIGPGAKESD